MKKLAIEATNTQRKQAIMNIELKISNWRPKKARFRSFISWLNPLYSYTLMPYALVPFCGNKSCSPDSLLSCRLTSWLSDILFSLG
jgi:cellulose synthase/poly-beta-1,6-N-acetylglucosamine synthase-like glycosyltransferase